MHNKNTLKESDLRFSNASKFLDLFVGACETEIASARGPGPVLLLLRSTHISRVVLMIKGVRESTLSVGKSRARGSNEKEYHYV